MQEEKECKSKGHEDEYVSINAKAIEQETERPIIFIAHSLGGIVVKSVWKPFPVHRNEGLTIPNTGISLFRKLLETGAEP